MMLTHLCHIDATCWPDRQPEVQQHRLGRGKHTWGVAAPQFGDFHHAVSSFGFDLQPSRFPHFSELYITSLLESEDSSVAAVRFDLITR